LSGKENNRLLPESIASAQSELHRGNRRLYRNFNQVSERKKNLR